MSNTQTHKLANNLACPIDGHRLEQHEKHLVCENGHTYDIAKQGYVNLLPVQQKRSKHPGDSKEMVVARAQFLNSAVYEPVAAMLVDMVMRHLSNLSKSCLLDAGCGEGYYLDYIFNTIHDNNDIADVSFIGLDISKDATVEAAKRNNQISWVVGTNRQPSVVDSTIDCIICVFGFHSYEGFYKTLKPGAKVILVEPGSEHLNELREIIYTDVKKSEPSNLSDAEKLGFTLIDTAPLQFKTGAINNEQINNLLLMTPHFYRASKEGKEAASKLKELDLTVDMNFSVLQKI